MLRKLAEKIAREDWRDYLEQAKEDTFEEVMLQGMVIGKVDIDKFGIGNKIEEKLKLVEEFIPKIDCWSVCDSFCVGLKMTRDHRERVWEFIQPYLLSNQEYDIRFGVVMLLNYYVLSDYAPKAFARFDTITHEGYYAKMAVAWAISTYYTKLPKITMEYLKNNVELDDFTYNKALQKIIESLKVEQEEKNSIRGMKRKSRCIDNICHEG